MVSRTTTTALLLLASTLAAMPAHADLLTQGGTLALEPITIPSEDPPVGVLDGPWPECPLVTARTDSPSAEVHDECLPD